MLDTKKKQRIIKKFATHDGDTGSSEVQIAILSSEIDELVDHLKKHPKDHSSRRGLLRKVSARRRLLRYLKKENPESHDELTAKLKLKKARKIENPDQEGEAPKNGEDLSTEKNESSKQKK